MHEGLDGPGEATAVDAPGAAVLEDEFADGQGNGDALLLYAALGVAVWGRITSCDRNS